MSTLRLCTTVYKRRGGGMKELPSMSIADPSDLLIMLSSHCIGLNVHSSKTASAISNTGHILKSPTLSIVDYGRSIYKNSSATPVD